MGNINIAKICGLCAGCNAAISETEKLLQSNKNVTLFKKIVHNKNVNKYLQELGASTHENIEEIIEWKNNIGENSVVVIRAHGEPPKTYEILDKHKLDFADCTCINVKRIHQCVEKFSGNGYRIILIGKYGKQSGTMHPEISGTLGWCKGGAILVEDEDDLMQIKFDQSTKFYLICQTTFSIDLAENLIEKAKEICNNLGKELITNKSICFSQKLINQSSVELAKSCDLMIVIGGKNSSNTNELFKNISKFCKTIFFEDIEDWKDEFAKNQIVLSKDLKIGITAGASTMQSELQKLKTMLEQEISN